MAQLSNLPVWAAFVPPPADGALHHLEIHKSRRELLFFRVISRDGPAEKIQPASSFGSRLVGLGRRAGYREKSTVYDIRAETLLKPMVSSL
jgi:hypothetical protein